MMILIGIAVGLGQMAFVGLLYLAMLNRIERFIRLEVRRQLEKHL